MNYETFSGLRSISFPHIVLQLPHFELSKFIAKEKVMINECFSFYIVSIKNRARKRRLFANL